MLPTRADKTAIRGAAGSYQRHKCLEDHRWQDRINCQYFMEFLGARSASFRQGYHRPTANRS